VDGEGGWGEEGGYFSKLFFIVIVLVPGGRQKL